MVNFSIVLYYSNTTVSFFSLAVLKYDCKFPDNPIKNFESVLMQRHFGLGKLADDVNLQSYLSSSRRINLQSYFDANRSRNLQSYLSTNSS